MTDQPPLPGMPPEAPKLPRATKPGVRTSRHKGRRALCLACTELIHTLGADVAPYPRTARWRLSVGESSYLVCDHHKIEGVP